LTTPPPYGQQPAAGNDKVTLWGILGIVFAFLCWPLGIVFAILCLNEAKKYNKPPTLAYVTFGILAVSLILGLILGLTGALTGTTGS
jgi:short subunit fatty acids transporter